MENTPPGTPSHETDLAIPSILSPGKHQEGFTGYTSKSEGLDKSELGGTILSGFTPAVKDSTTSAAMEAEERVEAEAFDLISPTDSSARTQRDQYPPQLEAGGQAEEQVDADVSVIEMNCSVCGQFVCNPAELEDKVKCGEVLLCLGASCPAPAHHVQCVPQFIGKDLTQIEWLCKRCDPQEEEEALMAGFSSPQSRRLMSSLGQLPVRDTPPDAVPNTRTPPQLLAGGHSQPTLTSSASGSSLARLPGPDGNSVKVEIDGLKQEEGTVPVATSGLDLGVVKQEYMTVSPSGQPTTVVVQPENDADAFAAAAMTATELHMMRFHETLDEFLAMQARRNKEAEGVPGEAAGGITPAESAAAWRMMCAQVETLRREGLLYRVGSDKLLLLQEAATAQLERGCNLFLLDNYDYPSAAALADMYASVDSALVAVDIMTSPPIYVSVARSSHDPEVVRYGMLSRSLVNEDVVARLIVFLSSCTIHNVLPALDPALRYKASTGSSFLEDVIASSHRLSGSKGKNDNPKTPSKRGRKPKKQAAVDDTSNAQATEPLLTDQVAELETGETVQRPAGPGAATQDASTQRKYWQAMRRIMLNLSMRLVVLIDRLTLLLRIERVSDTQVTTVLKLAFTILAAENVGELQSHVLPLVTAIFVHHPALRYTILDDVIACWKQVETSKKNVRSFVVSQGFTSAAARAGTHNSAFGDVVAKGDTFQVYGQSEGVSTGATGVADGQAVSTAQASSGSSTVAIQMLSALILMLLQSIPGADFEPKPSVIDTSEALKSDGKTLPLSLEIDAAMNSRSTSAELLPEQSLLEFVNDCRGAFLRAREYAWYFVRNFVGQLVPTRAAYDVHGNASPVLVGLSPQAFKRAREILTMAVEDVLAVLLLPEWPASESLLDLYVRHLISVTESGLGSGSSQDLFTSNATSAVTKDPRGQLRLIAIDVLGMVCAAAKHAGALAAATKLGLRPRRHGVSKAATVADENEEIKCICMEEDPSLAAVRGQEEEGMLYVDCDDCHYWFHGPCVGLYTLEDVEQVGTWYCDSCHIRREVEAQQRQLEMTLQLSVTAGDEEDLKPALEEEEADEVEMTEKPNKSKKRSGPQATSSASSASSTDTADTIMSAAEKPNEASSAKDEPEASGDIMEAMRAGESKSQTIVTESLDETQKASSTVMRQLIINYLSFEASADIQFFARQYHMCQWLSEYSDAQLEFLGKIPERLAHSRSTGTSESLDMDYEGETGEPQEAEVEAKASGRKGRGRKPGKKSKESDVKRESQKSASSAFALKNLTQEQITILRTVAAYRSQWPLPSTVLHPVFAQILARSTLSDPDAASTNLSLASATAEDDISILEAAQASTLSAAAAAALAAAGVTVSMAHAGSGAVVGVKSLASSAGAGKTLGSFCANLPQYAAIIAAQSAQAKANDSQSSQQAMWNDVKVEGKYLFSSTNSPTQQEHLDILQQIAANGTTHALHGAMAMMGRGVSLTGQVSRVSRLAILRICRQLSATERKVLSGLGNVLPLLLRRLPEPQTTFRVKAVRAVSMVVHADPSVLLDRRVREAIVQRVLDPAISVREAVMDLIGKYILNMPTLREQYYPVILDRLADPGVSVRKRCVRIVRDAIMSFIIGSSNDSIPRQLSQGKLEPASTDANSTSSALTDPNALAVAGLDTYAHAKFVEMAVCLLGRVRDEEDVIRQSVAKTFESLWFSPNFPITSAGAAAAQASSANAYISQDPNTPSNPGEMGDNVMTNGLDPAIPTNAHGSVDINSLKEIVPLDEVSGLVKPRYSSKFRAMCMSIVRVIHALQQSRPLSTQNNFIGASELFLDLLNQLLEKDKTHALQVARTASSASTNQDNAGGDNADDEGEGQDTTANTISANTSKSARGGGAGSADNASSAPSAAAIQQAIEERLQRRARRRRLKTLCREIVSCVVECLLLLQMERIDLICPVAKNTMMESTSASEYAFQPPPLIAFMQTLHVFCAASPSFVVAHATMLQPYLKDIEEKELLPLLTDMLSGIFPLLRNTHGTMFFNHLKEDLFRLIRAPKAIETYLKSAIPCVCAILNHTVKQCSNAIAGSALNQDSFGPGSGSGSSSGISADADNSSKDPAKKGQIECPECRMNVESLWKLFLHFHKQLISAATVTNPEPVGAFVHCLFALGLFVRSYDFDQLCKAYEITLPAPSPPLQSPLVPASMRIAPKMPPSATAAITKLKEELPATYPAFELLRTYYFKPGSNMLIRSCCLQGIFACYSRAPQLIICPAGLDPVANALMPAAFSPALHAPAGANPAQLQAVAAAHQQVSLRLQACAILAMNEFLQREDLHVQRRQRQAMLLRRAAVRAQRQLAGLSVLALSPSIEEELGLVVRGGGASANTSMGGSGTRASPIVVDSEIGTDSVATVATKRLGKYNTKNRIAASSSSHLMTLVTTAQALAASMTEGNGDSHASDIPDKFTAEAAAELLEDGDVTSDAELEALTDDIVRLERERILHEQQKNAFLAEEAKLESKADSAADDDSLGFMNAFAGEAQTGGTSTTSASAPVSKDASELSRFLGSGMAWLKRSAESFDYIPALVHRHDQRLFSLAFSPSAAIRTGLVALLSTIQQQGVTNPADLCPNLIALSVDRHLECSMGALKLLKRIADKSPRPIEHRFAQGIRGSYLLQIGIYGNKFNPLVGAGSSVQGNYYATPQQGPNSAASGNNSKASAGDASGEAPVQALSSIYEMIRKSVTSRKLVCSALVNELLVISGFLQAPAEAFSLLFPDLAGANKEFVGGGGGGAGGAGGAGGGAPVAMAVGVTGGDDGFAMEDGSKDDSPEKGVSRSPYSSPTKPESVREKLAMISPHVFKSPNPRTSGMGSPTETPSKAFDDALSNPAQTPGERAMHVIQKHLESQLMSEKAVAERPLLALGFLAYAANVVASLPYQDEEALLLVAGLSRVISTRSTSLLSSMETVAALLGVSKTDDPDVSSELAALRAGHRASALKGPLNLPFDVPAKALLQQLFVTQGRAASALSILLLLKRNIEESFKLCGGRFDDMRMSAAATGTANVKVARKEVIPFSVAGLPLLCIPADALGEPREGATATPCVDPIPLMTRSDVLTEISTKYTPVEVTGLCNVDTGSAITSSTPSKRAGPKARSARRIAFDDEGEDHQTTGTASAGDDAGVDEESEAGVAQAEFALAVLQYRTLIELLDEDRTPLATETDGWSGSSGNPRRGRKRTRPPSTSPATASTTAASTVTPTTTRRRSANVSSSPTPSEPTTAGRRGGRKTPARSGGATGRRGRTKKVRLDEYSQESIDSDDLELESDDDDVDDDEEESELDDRDDSEDDVEVDEGDLE